MTSRDKGEHLLCFSGHLRLGDLHHFLWHLLESDNLVIVFALHEDFALKFNEAVLPCLAQNISESV